MAIHPENTEAVPNYELECENCGQVPTVTIKVKKTRKVITDTGLCGPCCWGEAAMIDHTKWNED